MNELQELKGLQERLVIDTSEGKPVYLLAVGEKPTYVRLSPTSYYLLQQRSLGLSFSSISETLSQQGKLVSPDEVEAAYQKVIHQIAEIKQNPKLKHSGFFFRLPLFPKAIVCSIASCLSIAFYKPVTYGLLGFIAAATAIASRHDFTLEVTSSGFLWGYLLFLVSLLFHELGHASACVRYGAQPSEIGFTLYLIWPAFYSDVSAAWQLKRWQRVIVDVGGVFFQLVVAAIYVIAYTLTGWLPFKLALLMIAGSCLLTLNPVLKFDGYWVVADALGVTNLDRQPIRILHYFLNRICRKPVNPLPWSPWVIIILAFYTALSLEIWIYFLWGILPMLRETILDYPSSVTHLLSDPSVTSVTKELPSFLSSTFILIMGLLTVWHLLQAIANYLLLSFKKIQKMKSVD